MDQKRFDRWTRSMASAASRRGVVAGLAAGVVAAIERHVAPADAAAAVTAANIGKRRDSANAARGRSDARGKSGGDHRRPTRGAQGCTAAFNGCVAGMGGSCPNNRKGGCIVRDNGKPFCALSASCFPCAADADCDRAFETKGGVCITNCPLCQAQHLTSACAFAKPIPMAASAGGPHPHG